MYECYQHYFIFFQSQCRMETDRRMEQIFADRVTNRRFLNRERTLYVKACHLVLNCSCDVAIIIKTPQNQLRSFCGSDIHALLQTFLATRGTITFITQERIEKVCSTPHAFLFCGWPSCLTCNVFCN